MKNKLEMLFETNPEQALIEALQTLREKVKSAGCYVPYQELLYIPETGLDCVSEAGPQKL